MKKFFLLSIIILFLFSSFIINTFASTNVNDNSDILFIGTYETTESQLSVVKVYINDVTKEIYDNNGWIYYTEIIPIKFLWFTIFTINRYYVYENQYVDIINEKKELFNDIDSLIYIIRKLENYAFEYLQNNNLLSNLQGENNKKISDLVLGYIRSFNISYCNSSVIISLAWTTIAGPIDADFISYVNNNDYSSFSIRDYFASFCSPDNYNSELHGTIDVSKLKENK